MKEKWKTEKLVFLLALLPIVIIVSASVGSADLSATDSLRLILSKIPIWGRKIDISEIKAVYQTILFRVRLPRICLAGCVGAGLAVTGAVFQGLFRNPLADPHVLGVSSGACMGATLAILSGIHMNFMGLGAVGICAFLGALLTILLIYQAACTRERLPVVNLLLIGSAVSTMLSACISLMMSMNQEGIEKVYMWTLGSFSAATWTKVRYMLLFLGICGTGLWLLSKELNILTTGEDAAESMGVDLKKLKKRIIILASLLVAACVSVSGMIGFVGLIIPHCMRLIGGSEHKILILYSMLGGAVFMIFCDTIARTITAPSELPIGVVTALLGAPYFIYLIYKNSRR